MKSTSTTRTTWHKKSMYFLCACIALLGGAVMIPDAWAANPQKAKAALPGAKAKRISRITPQIPKANRYQTDKVFLENADRLMADERISTEYQILKGNVRFRRGDMYMFCDSAYFYEATSSLDAFGNVKMSQADTLFVYSDVLHYFGNESVAQLRGHVKMVNRNNTLTTDSLDYEISTNVGYYFSGGKIVDSKNNTTLTSRNGRYELDSKQAEVSENVFLEDNKNKTTLSARTGRYNMNTRLAEFYEDVVLVDKKDNTTLTSRNGNYNLNTKQAEFTDNVKLVTKQYTMTSNTLLYNTATHVAKIVDETLIESDGNTVTTNSGWYNTKADDATLFNRSVINTKDGKTLVGDTVYYNRSYNYGEARGNVVITDPKHKIILDGNYGYHDDNTHYSYVTRHARAREFSQKDTIYLHADTLCTLINDDSIRVLKAFNGVRFFREDAQGICDSLQMSMADTIINLYRHAVLWYGDRQVTGNEINAHLNDSTVDWATMPNFGFIAEHLGENYYDQLSAKYMKTFFENKDLKELDADGNVQLIMYPQENDSTYNKQVNAEGSYLRLYLKEKHEVEKIAMWPDVTGKVTPLFLIKRADLYLPGFVWYDEVRPRRPEDIFDVNEEMKRLMSEPEKGSRRSKR